MTEFLFKFACFDCRVAFKRPATFDSANENAHLADSEISHSCPNCGHRMAYMGRNFASPAKSDTSGWFAALRLWEAGFRFSGSGFHGSPSLPTKKADVEQFILDNNTHDQKIGSLNVWSKYV